MDAQRWRRVAAIFDELIDLPEPARRLGLERACGADLALRCEVDALLRHDAIDDRDLPESLRAPARVVVDWASDAEGSACDVAGLRIGPWRVLREIGRGGMGVVYLAERADGQYEQRAALKLVRTSGDPSALRRRFLRERQILARLEHPHIARLLDGGIAADGDPYFAMEFVDGRPLLAHVHDLPGDLELRLRLFLDICAAVQFAHRQLVVHRDIKPSNVLVTADGEVKLLDFGIATVLDAPPSADTQWRLHPLTPAYAAPEQLRGEPVSTTTDVYALGVLLHELMTGMRPYCMADDVSPIECLRIIEGGACRPPSALVENARREGTSSVPAVAARVLRGDLDLIILTALRAEPCRRYASVDALIEDLRRFRTGLPINARRDSVRYRFGRFVARHSVAVALAAATLIALLAVTDVALVQAHHAQQEARRASLAALVAERQAQRADAVKGFLLDTFRVAEPRGTPGGYKLGVADAVGIAAARLEAKMAKEPELGVEFALVLGEVYDELADYDASLRLLERAHQAHARSADPDQGTLADIESGLATAHAGKGEYAFAQQIIAEAIGLDGRINGRNFARTVRDLAIAAEITMAQGDFARAGVLLEEAFTISRAVRPVDDAGITHLLSDRALLEGGTGEPDKARETMIEVLARTRSERGERSLDAAIAMTGLAEADALTNRFAEALPLQREGVAIQRELFPPNHPFVVAAIASQANFEMRAHRYADAERDYREALDRARQSLGANAPMTTAVNLSYARLRYATGEFAGAVALDRQALGALIARGADADPHAIVARGDLGVALRETGDYAEAEKMLRAAQVELRRAFGDHSGFVAANLDQLAVLLRVTGRNGEALDLHAQSQSIYEAKPKTPPGTLGVSLSAFAETERIAGRRAQALAHIDTALDLLPRQLPPDDDAIAAALIVKGRLLVDDERSADAEPLLRRALDLSIATWGEQHWRTASARSALGLCLRARGRRTEATRLLAQAGETLERTRGKTFPLAAETRRALARR
ncbi:MAG: tetratricopeptide repeat protein [Burkholderiales bacterium]